jgi:Uma2 family endonuclease
MAELGFFQGERVELIRGIVIRMSPIGPRHRSVVDRLTELLVPSLVGRARVSIQQPFVACDESEPEPDVAVLPLARYSEHHPDRAHLIIEVAESSVTYDRGTKAPLYAASGVPEYWLVDVVARVVEVHTEPADGRYGRVARVEGDSVLGLGAFADVTFTVRDLFE